ncbi:MAG TPA: hypothetical protein DET40_04675 [Lentisphaeria bacterium]|nr:MAG: hypothetical protein A2X45_21450 [Lentisphaerae bacterium GWF2_50_93]HCE42819.1 hypothetical protein [Lentisphaeria bacterium]
MKTAMMTMVLILGLAVAAQDKPVKEPGELMTARNAYLAEQAKVTEKYLATLEAIKKKLGAAGRIDDAIVIKAEIDKLQKASEVELAEPGSDKAVGKWLLRYVINYERLYDIKSDGTFTYKGGNEDDSGSWASQKDGSLLLTFSKAANVERWTRKGKTYNIENWDSAAAMEAGGKPKLTGTATKAK